MNGRTKEGREKGLSANVYSLEGQESSGQEQDIRSHLRFIAVKNATHEGMGDLSVILESKKEHVSSSQPFCFGRWANVYFSGSSRKETNELPLLLSAVQRIKCSNNISKINLDRRPCRRRLPRRTHRSSSRSRTKTRNGRGEGGDGGKGGRTKGGTAASEPEQCVC